MEVREVWVWVREGVGLCGAGTGSRDAQGRGWISTSGLD